MSEYKKCPCCGEEILASAKKCKYCREWLTDRSEDTTNDIVVPQSVQSEKVINPYTSVQRQQSVMYDSQRPVVNVYTMVSAKKEKNGIGLAGFILSILCLVISWAPGVNIVMWFLGLVFSAVGVFKRPKGLAIAGLVISMISILIIILLAAVIGELASELFDELGL